MFKRRAAFPARISWVRCCVLPSCTGLRGWRGRFSTRGRVCLAERFRSTLRRAARAEHGQEAFWSPGRACSGVSLSVLSQEVLHGCDKTATGAWARLPARSCSGPQPPRAGREEAPVRCLLSGFISEFGAAERLRVFPELCSDLEGSLLLTLSK